LVERSFSGEVGKLTLGEGEVFHGENILAVAKALLQSGVSYIGGYPGAPISHLLDVFADAKTDLLDPMGVQFEQSASEAGAAALLGASINYPLRGAAVWKSVVGTHVASDALSNLASAGVVGGTLIVVGEDYGEGASIMQERTHPMAMKSSIPLLDPRYNMPRLVDLVERAFELSETSNLPVMMQLRIRACHLTGSFVARDNPGPTYGAQNPVSEAVFDYDHIVLPPSVFAQEKRKVEERLPAARRFITEHRLNEVFPGKEGSKLGIILQGGTYGAVLRSLRLLGLADALGATPVPVYCLNVVFPLVEDEVTGFLADKEAVLIVEEGNPTFIEEQIKAIAFDHGLTCKIHGKDVLPLAGEYVCDVVRDGLVKFFDKTGAANWAQTARARQDEILAETRAAQAALEAPMVARPPGFCTGCPERPLFSALKLVQGEIGKFHISSDIGCNLFSTLPPFNMGSTVLGYGLSLASASAIGPALDQPNVAVMGDGGFWHNGLTSGAIHAHWNKEDSVLIVLENGYAAATGQHHVPSTGTTPWGEQSRVSIEQALTSIGVKWIRRVDSYNVRATMKTLREALTRRTRDLRVIISDNECRLAFERRRRGELAAAEKAGKTVVRAKFGIDEEVCVGDHSCIRNNGCPSLSLRPARDPLKNGPTANIESSCVACGLCGELAHASALCPSFYKAERIINPGLWQRLAARLAAPLMALMGA
jgi:indolepyruvate ferredoxin oxidoreductase alpha subunit